VKHRRAQIVMALIGLVLSELPASRSWAQSPAESRADSNVRNSISRNNVDNTRPIRLASRKTGRVESHGVALLGDSVLLNTDSGVLAIALANVDSVWVPRGSAALLVGLIAGLPCALFGGIVGNSIGGDPDGPGSPGRATVLTILGFLGGGLVCGSGGAIIGSLIRYWHLEYARPANAAH
jgi:hypothetical protein